MPEDSFTEDRYLFTNDNGDSAKTPIEWFVGISDRQHGPFSEKQLVELVRRKVVGPLNYVWREGMEQWAHLQDMSELRMQIEQIEGVSEYPARPYETVQSTELESQPGELSVSSEPGELSVSSEPGELSVSSEPGELSVSSEPVETSSDADTQNIENIDSDYSSQETAPVDFSVDEVDIEPPLNRQEASTDIDQGEDVSENPASLDGTAQSTDLESQPGEFNLSSEPGETSSDADAQNIENADGNYSSQETAPIDPSVNVVDTELPPNQLEASADIDQDEDDEIKASPVVERTEPEAAGDQEPLQSETAETAETDEELTPLPEGAVRSYIQGDGSGIVGQMISDGGPGFRVPPHRSFGHNKGYVNGALDESYSLYNLVSNTPQKGLTDSAQVPAGYANEDNSGLIDLNLLDGSSEDSAPQPDPNRVAPHIRQKFDSLIPMERAVAPKSNLTVKLALVTGGGLLTMSVVASFLILRHEQPKQELSAVTSTSVRVSHTDSRVRPEEQKVVQIPVAPQKEVSIDAVPERKTVADKNDRSPSKSVIAPTKKNPQKVKNAKVAVRKESDLSSEKDSKEKDTQVPTRATSPDKSNISTDALLDWAVGKGNKAEAPPVTKSEPPAETPTKPEVEIPQQPSRADTLAALRQVTPDVKACGQGQSGMATASISVEGRSGKVTNVTITGVDSSVHECMKQAIGRARFPTFSNEKFNIKFPFRL